VGSRTPRWESFEDLPSMFDSFDVEAFLNAWHAGRSPSEADETPSLVAALETLRYDFVDPEDDLEEAWAWFEEGIRFGAEDSLVKYAKWLAKEHGEFDRNLEDWPRDCIDWKEVARNLRSDWPLLETTLGERVYLSLEES
jgi:hypothetical protein